MIKKIAFCGALALVVVGVAATDASASCNPPKFVQSYNPVSGNFTYWQTTATDTSPALVSKFISGGVDIAGSCQFLYWASANTPPGPVGAVGMTGDFGQACATGPCPGGGVGNTGNGVVTFIGQVGGQVFGSTVSEIGGVWDYSQAAGANGGIATAGTTPRPRATNSSRSGTNVVLALGLDAASAGFDAASAATITGYRVLSKAAASDPGRLASSYDAVPIATASGANGAAATAGASVDCTVLALDRWVVTQIVTSAGPLPNVSEATRVRCNAALANPPGYKMINKKPVVNTDK